MVNKTFKGVATLGATALMLVALTACGGSSNKSTPSVTDTSSLTITSANSVITATTKVGTLTIADVLPTGDETHSLTLTVDGVETPIAAGTFTSSSTTGVVLTPTTKYTVSYTANWGGSGATLDYNWRMGAYIKDGAPVLEYSVPSAIQGLTLTDSLTSLDSPKIVSAGPGFNGIVVDASSSYTGNSSFVIADPVISLTGNGGDMSTWSLDLDSDGTAETSWVNLGNDFSGQGAGLVVQGYANVVLTNPSIYTKGVIRTAVLVKEHGSLTVNGGEIAAHDGTIPEWYDYTVGTVAGQPWLVRGGYMSAVPWMLGLKGNCRATNLLDNGTAIYNGTRVTADGWAALSVDNNSGVSLMANGCDIDVTNSGYGSYSIGGGTAVHFSNCSVNVPDMYYILANGNPCATISGGVATTGRFITMSHSSSSGTVEINDGATVTTAKALFLLKSAATNFIVDNAVLTSNNGHILETAMNDDSGAGGATGTQTSRAVFTNTTLTGDVLNGNPYQQLSVTIGAGAKVTGAITGATYVSDAVTDGIDISNATTQATMASTDFRYMGAYTFAPGLSGNHYSNGGFLNVTLQNGGAWVLTGNSYLTSLTLDSASSVTASGTIYVTPYIYDAGTQMYVAGTPVIWDGKSIAAGATTPVTTSSTNPFTGQTESSTINCYSTYYKLSIVLVD